MWVWGRAAPTGRSSGMGRTSGERRAFHQMNLGWGVVNLGLASYGLWTATQAILRTGWWASYEACNGRADFSSMPAWMQVSNGRIGPGTSKNVARRERWRGLAEVWSYKGHFCLFLTWAPIFIISRLARSSESKCPWKTGRLVCSPME